MPHQLTSYIMVQSILMTRSVPSHHLLFDPLMLLCCMVIVVNFSELFWVLAERFNLSVGTNRGSPPQRPHCAAYPSFRCMHCGILFPPRYQCCSVRSIPISR